MFDRINIFPIIIDHFRTLYEYRPGGQRQPVAWWALMGFFGVPFIISAVLCYYGIKISKDVTNGLLTALTLLAGLMLNLLAIAYAMIKPSGTRLNPVDFSDGLRDTCANISYSVLASLVAIILLIMASSPLSPESVCPQLQLLVKAYNSALQIGIYFFLINNVLTLAMILQRVHALMQEEIRDNHPPTP